MAFWWKLGASLRRQAFFVLFMMNTQRMPDQNSLTDALALEKNRFMRSISDAATETQAEVAALEGQLAAKGLWNRFSIPLLRNGIVIRMGRDTALQVAR